MDNNTKHIVAFSGGHSSALVALEVAARYGTKNLILLNHDINPNVESEDIKRFKREVAEYIGVPITYASHRNFSTMDQFDVSIEAKAFKTRSIPAICTNRLKTAPFEKYLLENHKDKNAIIYYGFDKNEQVRINRRIGHLAFLGFKSDYPLATWTRTVISTTDIGILPPNTYNKFKHANCVGCIKAGKQHWYIVYLTRPDIFNKAKNTEEIIGHSIMKNGYLSEIEKEFETWRKAGLTTTEHEDGRTFAARARKACPQIECDKDEKPCECVF